MKHPLSQNRHPIRQKYKSTIHLPMNSIIISFIITNIASLPSRAVTSLHLIFCLNRNWTLFGGNPHVYSFLIFNLPSLGDGDGLPCMLQFQWLHIARRKLLFTARNLPIGHGYLFTAGGLIPGFILRKWIVSFYFPHWVLWKVYTTYDNGVRLGLNHEKEEMHLRFQCGKYSNDL